MKNVWTRKTMRAVWWVAAMSVVVAPKSARAGDVSVDVSGYRTYVGAPITVQVHVINAEKHDAPQFPEIDGADVHSRGANQSHQTTIINGRLEKKSTTTYVYDIIPRRVGVITIPPVRVLVDGEERQFKIGDIKSIKSDTGDLLFVRVLSDRPSVYVGEPLDATLEIWIKPFRNQRVALDHNDLFRCIDQNRSSFGAFTESVDPNKGRVNVRTERRAGDDKKPANYYVYSIAQRVWPERPGSFDAGGVNVLVHYPVDVARDAFSLFGRNRITKSRPVTASVEEFDVTIKPLPLDGRPDSFRGAVGQFTFNASAAPSEVAVGDPITLTLTIRGASRLDRLQPPLLTEQDALTAAFRVPDETIAGVVENGRKKFTQTIRAKNADVTSIPPVEFSYFDPDREQYVALQSNAIPIKVKEVSHVSVAQVTEGASQSDAPTRLTRIDAGLLGNYSALDALTDDQQFAPGVGAYSLLAAMPVVYLACFVAVRRKDVAAGNQAQLRRRSARKNAMTAIRAARSATAPDAIDAVASAVSRYVADRFDLPSAGLTRVEAIAALEQSGCPDAVARQADDLLTNCESARYAGGAESSSVDLRDRAIEVIESLERWRGGSTT